MAIEDFYNKTATVTRISSQTQDSSGSLVDVTTTFSLVCRINSLNSKEQVMHMKKESVVTHKLYCATGTAIQEDDEIAVGGLTLLVLGVRNIDLTDRFLTVDCTSRE